MLKDQSRVEVRANDRHCSPVEEELAQFCLLTCLQGQSNPNKTHLIQKGTVIWLVMHSVHKLAS